MQIKMPPASKQSMNVVSHTPLVLLLSVIPLLLALCTICVIKANKVEFYDDDFAEFNDLTDSPDVVSTQEQQPSIQDQIKVPKVVVEPTTTEESENNQNKAYEFQDDKFGHKSADTPGETEPKKRSVKNLELNLVNAPVPKFYTWESYYIEILFLLLLWLFFLNYYLGSSKNEQLAQECYKKMKELLNYNFSLVGGPPNFADGKKSEDDHETLKASKQKGLVKNTDNNFTLWNSGRIGIDGLLIEIDLLRRQDLFSMALTIVRPSKDNIIFRFLLTQDGYDNFVFCLANKTNAQRLSSQMVDINTFCIKKKPLSAFGVDCEKLSVLSEISDAASFILDDDTRSFIQTYQNYIDYIHITDRSSVIQSEEVPAAQRLAASKRMATFCFRCPIVSGARDRDLMPDEMLNFCLNLLDRIRKYRLSKDGKQKSDKNRQRITEILQKNAYLQQQELAQARKDEQRRKEKEQMINEDDPEKQKKFEIREAKRERKQSKNQKKIKMVMYR